MPLPDSLRDALKSSSSELGTTTKIKVLVCTVNIGNEAPDVESIGNLIPLDGDVNSVLQNQQYPLRNHSGGKTVAPKPIYEKSEDSSSLQPLKSDGSCEENNKFHIIAIGMQEATFEISEKANNLFSNVAAVHDACKECAWSM